MADTDKDEYWGRNAYGGYGDARDPSKPSGMKDETDRYANMGQQAANRQAYQQNYAGYQSLMDQANNTGRGGQTDALGMIRQRAAGQGPSAAEIAGANAQDQALAGTIAAAGTARGGPMQQAAVMRGSLGGLAAQNQGITNQIQAGRAAEMAQAQDAYMQGTTALRSGDFTGAGIELNRDAQQVQNEQFQRGLNQQAQENYEQQRQKVYEDQLAANQAAQTESDQAAAQNRQNTLRTEEDAWGKIKDVGSAVGAAFTGTIGGFFAKGGVAPGGKPSVVGEEGAELIIPSGDTIVIPAPQTTAMLRSDERAKLGIAPLGSLSGIGMTGMSGDSSPTGSMSVKGGGLDVMDSLAKTNAINTQYIKSPAGGMMRSDEQTKRGVVTMTDAEAQKQIAAAQREAGDEVASKRKAGGYADLDMTPIPRSSGDKGYSSDSDRAKTDRLHSAIEAETAGAAPYVVTDDGGEARGIIARDADPLGLDNPEEMARIRAQHPQVTLDAQGRVSSVGEWPAGSVGAANGQGHGKKERSGFSKAMLGMSQNFLNGSLGSIRPSYGAPAAYIGGEAGIHPGRDVTYSDARAKAEAFEEGVKRGSLQTHRMYTEPDYARSLGVEPYPGTVPQPAEAPKPAEIHGTREAVITTAGPSASRKETKEERVARGADKPSTLAALKERTKALASKATGATSAALDKMESTTTDTLGSLYPEAPETTTSDERAKKVLHEEEPMRGANLAMEASAYKYKPQFTPPGQDEGEVNVGPIAQKMERDPVARTAIVKDDSGLLAIDKEKGLKLAMGSLASLQRQIDEDRRRLSKVEKRSA